jgi:hypothetical protein
MTIRAANARCNHEADAKGIPVAVEDNGRMRRGRRMPRSASHERQ